MNKNLITKQNTNLVLNKSKSTLSITSKILSGKTSLTSEIIEDWIKEIWSWADENGIDSGTVPRNKDLLLALETIDLSGLELYAITSRLCFLEYVTTLILEDNNIEELPKEIVNFKNLKMLNLKNNPFTLTYTQKRWAEQLKDKGCVVHLNSDMVEYSQNKDLVGDSWIERLCMWADENNIPDLFWTKRERRKNGGYWRGLPRIKDKLLSFTSLNLLNNQLTELPKEIGNLTKLSGLYLGTNKLTALPKEIGNLENLIESDFGANYLTALPKELGNLTNLTKLNLRDNQLTKLPNEIGNLTNLTYLNLGGNQLTELPNEIRNLMNLTYLDLKGNQLTELSKEIGNLTNLAYLNLKGSQLTELPKEIGDLINLMGLSFWDNQLTELSKEIGNLTNLTKLNLRDNQLTELPKELGNLTNLTELDLKNNSELNLTEDQKKWIIKLRENGCNVGIDDDLFKRNTIQKIDINEDEIPSLIKKSDNSVTLHPDIMMINGLMWQKETVEKKMNWDDAMDYAKNLRLSGYDDWRLPTIDELEEVVRFCGGISVNRGSENGDTLTDKNADNSLFQLNWERQGFTSGYYWSSTTHDSNTYSARGVYINYGYTDDNVKDGYRSVRCVRSGQ